MKTFNPECKFYNLGSCNRDISIVEMAGCASSGEAVRLLRNSLRMGNKDLARLLGYSSAHIAMLQTSSFDFEKLTAICEALNVCYSERTPDGTLKSIVVDR